MNKAENSMPSRGLVLAAVVVLLLLVGFVDYATGWELSLVMLYAVPVFLTAWYVDRAHALRVAVLGAGIWWCANLRYHPYQTAWGFGSATLTRLAYFLFVALGGTALRAQRDADRDMIAALERTRLLQAEIVRASECEQQRIGRDLHDGLCQSLAGIRMAAKTLADDLAAQGAAAAAEAREIEALLNEGVRSARSLARGLVPVHLGDDGLCLALEELASVTRRLTRVAIGFESSGEVKVTDRQVATQLYRITQEALSNAMRHGQARQIVISLEAAGDQVVLSVADDGSGFSTSSIQTGGVGLASMRCRAESIGADLRIGPRPTGGTLLTCTLPIRTASTAPFGGLAEAV